MKTLILASASPRRRELLALTGSPFIVDPSEYPEDLSLQLEPPALARHLSREKAKAVAGKYRHGVIIAADTIVVAGRSVLGKPRSKSEAKEMLRALSGKAHTVITGYTVLDTGTGGYVSKAVATKVWFKRLTDEEINAYVKTGEPLDNAGAYAIQGRGSLIVKKIEGDYFNVIGLPLSALAESLKKFGIRIL